MQSINLLPWRAAQRQHDKKRYIRLLVICALGAFGVTGLISAAINQLLLQQQQRNSYLQDKIALLDAQIVHISILKADKSILEQKMRLVQQLQLSRNATPTIFDQLATLVPTGVTFTTMQRTNNLMVIEGHSESNNHLAKFMRKLNQSLVFLQAELVSIKANISATQVSSEFKLTFVIAPHIAPHPERQQPKSTDGAN